MELLVFDSFCVDGWVIHQLDDIRLVLGFIFVESFGLVPPLVYIFFIFFNKFFLSLAVADRSFVGVPT